MKMRLKRFFYLLMLFALGAMLAMPGLSGAKEEEQAPGRKLARQAIKDRKIWNTTDHTKHEALRQNFKSGDEVTRACLTCHSEAEEQFKMTIHWTWIDPNSAKDTITGKAGHSLNNFCISANKMKDKGCNSCHTGWNGKNEGVNCLVCHSQKLSTLFNSNADFDNIKEAFATYKDFAEDPDAKEMADEIQTTIHQAVTDIGRPTRKNCGSCHFYGGGGDGVKHGDLDSSMTKPSKSLDVHMGLDGQNFQCTRCHTTKLHNIAGRIYATPASMHRKSLIEDDLTPKIMCESCHSDKPHKSGSKPNDHTDKVACQSCHIPEFARANPTKMSWDWSKAGKLKDGKPYKVKGDFGKHNYLSIKGEMRWDKHVKPEYFWFNGSIITLTAKDIIDPTQSVPVGKPVGAKDDPDSRIFPFKIHRGKQPYDKVNNTLLTPHLSGKKGYWATLDWNKALSLGMKETGVPFSGEFDFVETTYAFPTTHMVAPREATVKCSECHTRSDGRLAQLTGFYMPGRDCNDWLAKGGLLLVIGSLVGVFFHGVGRIISRKKKEV
ncbi:tetrathionate reductase family octaheme c-type cytochrome [Desulfococcaceae bacterium HSG7]|nr:tetrathionate reductase family octaheme c-type cytochrome [Desulfococcaceae bacterium HSG9]MDM8553424.1 tetrathionate reductase family octaheme c-type cytochrome [Desulfococcaceae bacterium HSG7]